MSTEAWSWGDLFELDVPTSALVRDLGEMVELRFSELPDTPVLLAAFSPLPDAEGGPEHQVRSALLRFAKSRGLAHGAMPSLHVDRDGVVAGRVAFRTDLAWEALAVGWNRHLVVAFSAASTSDDPIFDQVEDLLSSLRPMELLVPARVAAEAEGDF
jgi:hypothetical protein